MDRFSKFNPRVTFLFFVLAMVLTLAIFNPVYSLISLLSAVVYKYKLEGKRTVGYVLKFIVPLLVLVSLFNMLFTHYGATALFTAFDMSFTFEGLFYGFSQGLIFSAIVTWFSCYSVVVTSERFLSVFGKVAPNTAIVLSMVLSFIPRLKKNADEINDARLLIDTENSRLKKSISNFSALITMTLEESIQVAESMKARHFCNGKTSYSRFRYSYKDAVLTILLVALFIVVAVYKAMGRLSFIFEPVITMESISPMALASFSFLMLMPVIIDVTEDVRWLYLKQKI